MKKQPKYSWSMIDNTQWADQMILTAGNLLCPVPHKTGHSDVTEAAVLGGTGRWDSADKYGWILIRPCRKTASMC